MLDEAVEMPDEKVKMPDETVEMPDEKTTELTPSTWDASLASGKSLFVKCARPDTPLPPHFAQ